MEKSDRPSKSGSERLRPFQLMGYWGDSYAFMTEEEMILNMARTESFDPFMSIESVISAEQHMSEIGQTNPSNLLNNSAQPEAWQLMQDGNVVPFKGEPSLSERLLEESRSQQQDQESF